MPSDKPLPNWAYPVCVHVKGVGCGGQENDPKEQFSHEEGQLHQTIEVRKAGEACEGGQGRCASIKDPRCPAGAKGEAACNENPEARTRD